MKKYIALLLALVLCLSLCACGEGSTPTEPSNNNPNANTSTPASNETEETPTEASETAIQSHPLLEKVYGEWALANSEDAKYNPFSAFSINEDGTCVVDGVSGTWEINTEYTNETHLWLNLLNGESLMGAIEYAGEYGSLSACNAAPIMNPGSWVNKSGSITVELTPENWSEYFELVELVEYETDEFGDFRQAGKIWNLQLKSKYAPLKYTRYELHFEVTWTTAKMNCEIDHDNKTITVFGEPEDAQDTTEKKRITLGLQDYCQIQSAAANESDNTIRVLTDMQVLRIAGDTTIELQEVG